MKLSLVNLVPLKEVEFDSPAPEGMDIPNFDSLVDALRWKNDLENYSMDLENELKHAQRQFDDKLSGQEERGAEPEGGPIQQKIAGELNQIESNIKIFKKELNTVLAKLDYFDQNYLSEGDYADRLANSGTDSKGLDTWGNKTGYSDKEMDDGKGKLKTYPDKDGLNVWGDKVDYSDAEKKAKGLNEAKIKSAEEFAATASDEQKAMAKKWDSLVTTIAFKKEDPKQHTANMEAKQEYLTNLNNAGKLKKKYSDDKIEDWSISSSLFGWKVASTVLPTPTNEDYKPSHRAYNVIDKSKNDKIVAKELSRDKALELAHTNKNYMISATDRLANEGSCGYGPDGVPGNTPGETQGMDADDRTRGMLRKLIQKEIAKLHETK